MPSIGPVSASGMPIPDMGPASDAPASGWAGKMSQMFSGMRSTSQQNDPRMFLVHLQVFIVVLAVLFQMRPNAWLGGICKGPAAQLGVCHCNAITPLGNSTLIEPDVLCWSTQMMYRVTSSGFLVFVYAAMMAISGYHDRLSLPFCLAFITIMSAVFIFFPNTLFTCFVNFAEMCSIVFISGQTLLLVDFTCRWNDSWAARSDSVQGRDIGFGTLRNWQCLLVLVSLLTAFSGCCFAIGLLAHYHGHGWWLVILLLMAAFALGAFGISGYAHARGGGGNLLTASIMILYAVWLMYEALVSRPDKDATGRSFLMKLTGLTIAALCLHSMALNDGLGIGVGSKDPESLIQEMPDIQLEVSFNQREFLIQCGIHAAAALYITVELAPLQGWAAYTFRTLDAIAALGLYGWTLAAPLFMRDRNFSVKG